MKNIIIVPAKGESKRFPKKNWMKLGEYTLFELALFRAMKSHLGTVVFATDSEEMAEKVFKRVFLFGHIIELPEAFAQKRAVNSCVYVLEKLREQGLTFDNIIVTLPTSPLANERHLQEAYKVFTDYNRQTLGSFTSFKGRPNLWGWELLEGSPFFINSTRVPKEVWRDNGAVYISTVKRFLEKREWFDWNVIPYFMNEAEGIDVDTQLDYLMAKTIYETKEMAD
uniref:Putative cytidylyltransferase n=1 Tax=viral metagenome TaxID=1070528 RepID=A0A6M3ITY5_9ZZZZ